MTTDALAHLKFPIGPFQPEQDPSREALDKHIAIVRDAPALYRDITQGLSVSDFKKTYREGAWNIQQLVNHLADMHVLHYFRMKKALTEPDYKEITLVNIDGWANTADSLNTPIEISLVTLDSITTRYLSLVTSLTDEQLNISYYHPVRKIMLNQKQAVSMTSWHVRHHLEHIKIALSN